MSLARLQPILLLLLSLLLTPVSTLAQGRTLHVVVSIKPIHSIVAALMQGGDEPQLLVSGAESPFDYRLTVAQQAQIDSADLLVWSGAELEPFLAAAAAKLATSKQVVELLAHPALKILPDRWVEGQRDPFFWMDSRNMLILTDELTRTLMETDPVRTHLYLRNRSTLLDKLAAMDRRFEYGYRGLSQGIALLYYDTLHYFSQAYATHLGEVLSPLPPRPVATEMLLLARNRIKNGDLVCLLTEAGMPNEHLPLLTDGLNVKKGELDSFGRRFQPGPELYMQMMEYNTGVIQACLGGKTAGSPYIGGGDTPGVDRLGGRFILTDHTGREVTEADLLGSYHILFFGYTQCPDVCPTSLQVLSQALKMLGKDEAKRFNPWFITLDPERDGVVRLREYVGYFGDKLLGLTGSRGMLETVVKQYRVKYEKVADENGDPAYYTLDHTASLFLIGPDGRFITKYAPGITPQALAERLRTYR
ncbi:MAG: SCO family protein [Gammaproteobacteria bacterium]|nr:SCO family protein [Gammaproteobacteria bacterium]